MENFASKGENQKKEAENIITSGFGWGLFTSASKYEDASEFYQQSATSFKLAKSWDQAGSSYINLAECHLKVESKHESAAAYVDAAHCYKKISPTQAISCMEQAVNLFSGIGRFSMAARYCKELGELHEQQRNFEEAIRYFEQAAEFFQGEESTAFASQCKQKVGQFFAQLQLYRKAIEVFEEVAGEAVNSNLLRYGVRGHLLNAGICHLCNGDIVAVTNAVERYQDLDPTFSRTREYQLLTELIATCDEEDVEHFTEVLKDYDSLSPLDSWKTILLLRVKEALKAKELDDDLT